jgi:hypothetical protein
MDLERFRRMLITRAGQPDWLALHRGRFLASDLQPLIDRCHERGTRDRINRQLRALVAPADLAVQGPEIVDDPDPKQAEGEEKQQSGPPLALVEAVGA